jgi:hypothetical protein
LAARVAAKRRAQQAEEEAKVETEDGEWGANVLDAMIDQLGTRKEVEKDIRDHHRKQEFTQRLANFSHADKDGNSVMRTKYSTWGFGPSSRDANHRVNVVCLLLVGGGQEKGFCAVPKCDHPKMKLLHKCATCKQCIHRVCSMGNNLVGEDECFYCSCNCHPSKLVQCMLNSNDVVFKLCF